ncbi:hypothetical protein LTS18_000287 [Coniosporium uncinatum]|uniref:Uncharacterized protein n=1 Tax=Coniosporium uncinatum TaxID=93489 RepID=A0ACC3DG12_9PEZI|nr:hypothetical protein LTS18_000287 [Coniosporium uncinatum]
MEIDGEDDEEHDEGGGVRVKSEDDKADDHTLTISQLPSRRHARRATGVPRKAVTVAEGISAPAHQVQHPTARHSSTLEGSQAGALQVYKPKRTSALDNGHSPPTTSTMTSSGASCLMQYSKSSFRVLFPTAQPLPQGCTLVLDRPLTTEEADMLDSKVRVKRPPWDVDIARVTLSTEVIAQMFSKPSHMLGNYMRLQMRQVLGIDATVEIMELQAEAFLIISSKRKRSAVKMDYYAVREGNWTKFPTAHATWALAPAAMRKRLMQRQLEVEKRMRKGMRIKAKQSSWVAMVRKGIAVPVPETSGIGVRSINIQTILGPSDRRPDKGFTIEDGVEEQGEEDESDEESVMTVDDNIWDA